MKIAELKKAKDRRPFQAFKIRTADGREIQIGHPDAIAWEDEQARIVLCVPKGGEWEVVDVALITSLAMPGTVMGEEPAKAKGNGA